MNIALRLVKDSDNNPENLPPDFIADAREIGDATELPNGLEGGTYSLISREELFAYRASIESDVRQWEADRQNERLNTSGKQAAIAEIEALKVAADNIRSKAAPTDRELIATIPQILKTLSALESRLKEI